jgi:hypothetical protein
LLSTLSCPHRELVAITERLAPNFECYNHGNLPETIPESFEVNKPAETITVAQLAKPKPLNHGAAPISPLTRVEIDSRGRRALVNEMR